MALELLAGPFTVTNPLAVVVSNSLDTFAYVDGHGLCANLVLFDGAGALLPGGFGVIEHDGTCFVRGSTPDSATARLGINGNTGLFLQSGGVYAYNAVTADLSGTSLFAPLDTASIVRLPNAGRFLKVYTPPSVVQSSTDGVTWTTEYTFTGGFAPSGVPSVALRRNGNLVLGYTNGVILTYDTTLMTRAVPDKKISFTTAIRGIWYSEKNDIFISLHGAYSSTVPMTTRIWANSTRPTALSNPTGTLSKGRASLITVQLTGADGDVCPGELIDWTLTGTGALSASQSTTDVNGYATTRYIALLTTLPTVTIGASVRF